MSSLPVAIPHQPARKPAFDYQRLRSEGIGYIEQMGSALWTDYNAHDPGITILEGLCYILTELAYRSGWDMRDLLTPAPGAAAPPQAFFTAREILTVNPVTPDDLRRLLIGLDAVRNAWVACKECACDVHYYAWCEDDRLMSGWRKPADPKLEVRKIGVRGMYDVVIELGPDAESGDLNDRKIEFNPGVADATGSPYRLPMELRFPSWELARPADWSAFLGAQAVSAVRLLALGATKSYNVLADGALDEAARDAYLRRQWNQALYLTLEIELAPSGAMIVVEHVALHLFGDNSARTATTVSALKVALEAGAPAGFVAQYRARAAKAAVALEAARRKLAAHRSLAEDFCRIGAVEIEDVAVCADLEVTPGADIERVQAEAWFAIERYFNPPLPHYNLQEMIDSGAPVEDIFNGPPPENGFIRADDLAAAGLKTVLRTSDIVNLLMEIDGVLAVNSLLLSKYDAEGRIVKGAADPATAGGALVFDSERGSAAWQLFISPLHQPRLYFRRSRFLFYKNGLPFLARADEAADTLAQLRGEAERPKLRNTATDLPVPAGVHRNPEQYYPLQYSFPLAWGVGPAGLPSHAPPLRRAQARQLQAYLMVFEQLLANAYAQLAHTADLFSLDPAVTATCFPGKLGPDVIAVWGEVVAGRGDAELKAMLESAREFRERRNRFLDHLLARFGESFGDYALLLTRLRGDQAGADRLISDKIAFLNAYPAISSGRARAFDYTRAPCAPGNIPGIKKRIALLLGFPDLVFSWTLAAPATVSSYVLKDTQGSGWLAGTLPVPVTGPDDTGAVIRAYRAVTARMTQAGAWHIAPSAAQFRLELRDAGGEPMGAAPEMFASKEAAGEMAAELTGWASSERSVVVEHVLLRPKFPGDALYEPCSDGACDTCDNADPYSFRLSFVMPGWTGPFSDDLDLRAFASRTIGQELPSHLLAKTCWVGNDGFIEDPCDPVIAGLAALLEAQGMDAGGNRPGPAEACSCANAIYAAFSSVFAAWYAGRTLDYLPPAALRAALEGEFAAKPDPASLGCVTVFDAALLAQVRASMVTHFHAIATNGWQFERFADAWCAWLDANSAFDWTSERLQARAEAILAEGLVAGPPASAAGALALCSCAAGIVAARGIEFDAWVESNIAAGKRPADFSDFTPAPVVLCAGMDFKPGTGARLEALLSDRYAAYTEVSYRLRIVLRLLAGLRNSWPGATLHDCDDGSDLNPVRLGSTALGSHLRRPAAPRDPI